MLIFVDGAEGATGLNLERRLSKIPGVELIRPEKSLRKDAKARKEYLNRADVVFLCLPDAAAVESANMVENKHTVIIDASSAHRIADGWAYGFPELSDAHREAIKVSERIAVPGCHASGFCAIVYPLILAGLIKYDETICCNSLTGYSGGGRAMIQAYEESGASPTAAKPYALRLTHKHLPEMRKICGLSEPPIFQPVIVNARQGMIVSVPLAKNAIQIWSALSAHYGCGGIVSVKPFGEYDSLELESMNGTDNMEIFVFGNERQTVVSARFDNLGKGSCGAAIQCFRLRMKI